MLFQFPLLPAAVCSRGERRTAEYSRGICMSEYSGFVKIHRKFLDWEWYKDQNTFRVFMHCLLMANWKDGKFMGQVIPRGSFVTSYTQLAEQTSLSVQSVRTAINHLKSTGELTVKSHSKFSVYTVVNYGQYQDDNTQTNSQPTVSQQSANSQLTTIEEIKKERKEEYINTYEPEHHLFGIYHNVRLTDDELNELMKQHPDDYLEMIENMSTYMRSNGKVYADHFATLMRWKRNDKRQEEHKPKGTAERYDFWAEFDKLKEGCKNVEG